MSVKIRGRILFFYFMRADGDVSPYGLCIAAGVR